MRSGHFHAVHPSYTRRISANCFAVVDGYGKVIESGFESESEARQWALSPAGESALELYYSEGVA